MMKDLRGWQVSGDELRKVGKHAYAAVKTTIVGDVRFSIRLRDGYGGDEVTGCLCGYIEDACTDAEKALAAFDKAFAKAVKVGLDDFACTKTLAMRYAGLPTA